MFFYMSMVNGGADILFQAFNTGGKGRVRINWEELWISFLTKGCYFN